MSKDIVGGRENCVLLFVKSPDKGMVKVRLSEDVDCDTVLSLYRNFVLDLLDTMRTGQYALRICFYPPESERSVSKWLGGHYSYIPQKGEDLGDRMKNAFSLAFSEGFSRVLLVGSDVPNLTNAVINEAFELQDHDAVIGPAFDGGYYLIGFKSSTFLPEIFKYMPWSTGTVFEKTMKRFKEYAYKIHVLSELRDIDRLDDLIALVDSNMETEFANSRTMAFIFNNLKKLFLSQPVAIRRSGNRGGKI